MKKKREIKKAIKRLAKTKANYSKKIKDINKKGFYPLKPIMWALSSLLIYNFLLFFYGELDYILQVSNFIIFISKIIINLYTILFGLSIVALLSSSVWSVLALLFFIYDSTLKHSLKEKMILVNEQISLLSKSL